MSIQCVKFRICAQIKRVVLIFWGTWFACGVHALAQSPCTPTTKLYCLIQNQLGTQGNQITALTALNEAVGTVVSDLPLASPASGVIYNIDPQLKLSVPSDATLGPILTQRPETVGRKKVYLSVVYQYFHFSEVDGNKLNALPSVTTTSDLAFVAVNDLDLLVNQTVGYLTYGIASRIDVSAALPILDVHESFTSVGSKYITSSNSSEPSAPIYVHNSASATGIGDFVFAAKVTLWKPPIGGLATGLEVRVPTGDAEDFLGSGTTGVKPYVSFAFGKRISVHANLAYQVNGNTKLVVANSGGEGRLPNRLFGSGGVEWGPRKWITLVADGLGERVFDARRIAISSSPVNADTFRTIKAPPPVNSYGRGDSAFGAKIKYRNLLLTGNAVINLNDSGLRAHFVPLGGVSYTF